MKHLLATVGSVAAILVVGGLDHFFHSEILTALGVTLVFVTIGLIAAGALRLLWHGLQRLGVVHHGPPSFRVQDGETDIYVHRWKAFAYTVLPAAFGLLGLVLAAKDGAPWEIWLGIVGAFTISGVFLWRYGPSRLLDRAPALVIDAHGIRDPVKGIDVGWDEVERLVPWEQVLSAGATNRWLGIVPRDEEAVLAHQARSVQLAAGLDERAQVGEAPINVQLNLLATTTDELVAQIRRYWNGPIDDYPLERTSRPGFGVRRSRGHRFLVWAGNWLIAAAIGGVIVAVCIWLGIA